MGILFFGKKKQAESASLSADLEVPRRGLGNRIRNLFTGGKLDEAAFEELEEILITADVGIQTTMTLMKHLREVNAEAPFENRDTLKVALLDALRGKVRDYQLELRHDKLDVLLMMGVNGVGKTTTIAKLAHLFKSEGVDVMLAACDTFRAAAVQQLSVWADRIGVPIVKDEREGADPGSVLFRAVDEAFTRKAPLLLVDTAGRMHTRANLMQEMEKLARILKRKSDEGALTVQNLMVLDANTGQNALEQAKEFHQAAGIDGVVLTKLDSTAKGGIVLAIAYQLGIPIAFVGTGERLEALSAFDTEAFLDAVLTG